MWICRMSIPEKLFASMIRSPSSVNTTSEPMYGMYESSAASPREIGILAVITRMAIKGEFSPAWYAPVEIIGLYWHFVDIVWIFLFPLLYLVERHG